MSDIERLLFELFVVLPFFCTGCLYTSLDTSLSSGLNSSLSSSLYGSIDLVCIASTLL